MLTPEHIATETQLHVQTIRRLCARGDIRAHKLAGQWRIPEDDYEAWLASGRPEPAGVAQPDSRRTMPSRRKFRLMVGGSA